MTDTPSTDSAGRLPGDAFVVRRRHIEPIDRGSGVRTFPFVGRWSPTTSETTSDLTTGMTVFDPERGLPEHSHNVEETVLVWDGLATAVVDGERVDLEAGDATWVPADVPHYFFNRGDTPLTIYWVYGGRDVTRTLIATGETFEHLSERDRGGRVTD